MGRRRKQPISPALFALIGMACCSVLAVCFRIVQLGPLRNMDDIAPLFSIWTVLYVICGMIVGGGFGLAIGFVLKDHD